MSTKTKTRNKAIGIIEIKMLQFEGKRYILPELNDWGAHAFRLHAAVVKQ